MHLFGICNILTTFAQNSSKMEKERTVIHLEINGEHHYYGSVANMYEFYTSEELGITYASLRNYGITSEHPYKIRSVSSARVYCCLRVVAEASANLNKLSEDRDGKPLFFALVKC